MILFNLIASNNRVCTNFYLQKSFISDVDIQIPYLLTVRVTENYVQQMFKEVFEYSVQNFSGPQIYITFYKPYLYIFTKETQKNLEELFNEQPLPPMKVIFKIFVLIE